MSLHGFDRIAAVYDLLAKLVFGRSIQDSQRCFLHQIPPEARVLILGGGTGWLAAELLRRDAGVQIWYIDASSKMIDLARKKVEPQRVHFILGTEDDIPAVPRFDAVITNYYLDLFTTRQLRDVIRKIETSLDKRAIWLVADFVDRGKLWQRIMLRLMYFFFSNVAGVKTTRLPDWKGELAAAGWINSDSRHFYSEFTEGAVFKKASSP